MFDLKVGQTLTSFLTFVHTSYRSHVVYILCIVIIYSYNFTSPPLPSRSRCRVRRVPVRSHCHIHFLELRWKSLLYWHTIGAHNYCAYMAVLCSATATDGRPPNSFAGFLTFHLQNLYLSVVI